MKQSVKNAWVKALRSGKYRQGMHRLEGDNRFCCLGVLATLVDPERKTWAPERASFGTYGKQAELIGGEISNKLFSKLVGFNDGQSATNPDAKPKSFKWIASYIERYL